tara:strand:- start:6526 stop:7362 length:837 start_codon:yes stop_codon:yes gene_type:complete
VEREKTTKNIGKLESKVLIFGGVYSNLQALEGLLKIAKEKGIPNSNMICTGDIIGYCAQPNECLQTFQDLGIASIAGNVEIQLREEQEDCGCDFSDGGRCDLFSKNWYAYAQKKLNPKFLNYLNALPHFINFEYAGKKVSLVHGSYHHISEFIFKSSPWSKKEKNFRATNSDIIIAGHSGLPFVDQKEDLLWINPGVIGMPANDGKTKVWYGILNDEQGRISYEFHNFEYDFNKAAGLMLENNLPASYAQTLKTGLWDNCEILPRQETLEQGKPLKFE